MVASRTFGLCWVVAYEYTTAIILVVPVAVGSDVSVCVCSLYHYIVAAGIQLNSITNRQKRRHARVTRECFVRRRRVVVVETSENRETQVTVGCRRRKLHQRPPNIPINIIKEKPVQDFLVAGVVCVVVFCCTFYVTGTMLRRSSH